MRRHLRPTLSPCHHNPPVVDKHKITRPLRRNSVVVHRLLPLSLGKIIHISVAQRQRHILARTPRGGAPREGVEFPARHRRLEVITREGRIGQNTPRPRRRIVFIEPGNVAAHMPLGDAANQVEFVLMNHHTRAAAPPSCGNRRAVGPGIGGGIVFEDAVQRRFVRPAARHRPEDVDLIVPDHGLEVVNFQRWRGGLRPGTRFGIENRSRIHPPPAEQVELLAYCNQPRFVPRDGFAGDVVEGFPLGNLWGTGKK